MKNKHPGLWGAGWAGLAFGGALTLIGLTSRSDVASLVGGYGLMLMGASLFLVAGLRLLEWLLDRGESRRVYRAAMARLYERRQPTFAPAPSSAVAAEPARARTS